MDSTIQAMDTASYMEKFLPLLEISGEPLPLPALGHSMSPFLRHQRDTVYLAPVHSLPRRGDVVLYRRSSGQYVLHRIYKTENGLFTMVGDAQIRSEPGIRPDQIKAVAVKVLHNGHLLASDSLYWRLFSGPWNRLLPIRPIFIKLYRLFIKPFRRAL